MKYILKLIDRFTPRKDRLSHFYWGMLYLCLGSVLDSVIGAGFLYIAMPIFTSVVKETYDKIYGRIFDIVDLLMTVTPLVLFELFLN